MKDGIIKKTKNSRLLKAELPATYAELAALAAGDGIPADVLFHAEGWQQLPTFLNKKNLLQDSTAGLLGLTGDPTVDDAFVALLLSVKQMALVRVTVTVAGSPAIADIEITGLEGLDGGAVYTDASGIAVGFAQAGRVAISVPVYQDLIGLATATKDVAPGEIVDMQLGVAMAPQAGDKTVTATTSNIRFSPYTDTVDVCCIGGGAGGDPGTYTVYPEEAGYAYVGGSGGGQGDIVNAFNIVPDPKESYTAIIGAKGIGAYVQNGVTSAVATSGGKSSFMGVDANGGTRFKGGGGAGYSYNQYESPNLQQTPANPGSPATTHIFDDTSIPLTGGTGGGGGAYGIANAEGGSPGGGDGGSSTHTVGYDGTSYGAGGGGGYASVPESSAVKSGGDGYQGFIRFRWRLK